MNMQAITRRRGRAVRYATAALGTGAVVLALGAFTPAAAQAAAPATLYVSPGGLDSGTCPLASPCATVSYALTQAASGATINVTGTIKDHLTITSPVTITAWPGHPPAVLDGTATGATVVSVVRGVTGVTLHDLTIQNSGEGGIGNSGALTLTDSTVSGNPEGGIANDSTGTMTIIDSTISGNTSTFSASAGIGNAGMMTVIASTIAGNTAGAGISTGAGVITLGATIVAGNSGGNCVQETAGSLGSAGYNLTNDKTGKACGFTAVTDRVNKNPLLGHLASNGGPLTLPEARPVRVAPHLRRCGLSVFVASIPCLPPLIRGPAQVAGQ